MGKKSGLVPDGAVLRYFDAEMRAGEGDEMVVEGYALKYEKETWIGSKKWGWREKIARTALSSANLDNVIFDFNHSFDSLLARTKNGSLMLSPDGVGLKISARIIDTSIGRDVYRMIQDGLVSRMSFMAVVKTDEWTYADESGEDSDARTILGFGDFYDVSAVTFPAYEDTEISARCMAAEAGMRSLQIYERQIQKLNKILGGMKK